MLVFYVDHTFQFQSVLLSVIVIQMHTSHAHTTQQVSSLRKLHPNKHGSTCWVLLQLIPWSLTPRLPLSLFLPAVT